MIYWQLYNHSFDKIPGTKGLQPQTMTEPGQYFTDGCRHSHWCLPTLPPLHLDPFSCAGYGFLDLSLILPSIWHTLPTCSDMTRFQLLGKHFLCENIIYACKIVFANVFLWYDSFSWLIDWLLHNTIFSYPIMLLLTCIPWWIIASSPVHWDLDFHITPVSLSLSKQHWHKIMCDALNGFYFEMT